MAVSGGPDSFAPAAGAARSHSLRSSSPYCWVWGSWSCCLPDSLPPGRTSHPVSRQRWWFPCPTQRPERSLPTPCRRPRMGAEVSGARRARPRCWWACVAAVEPVCTAQAGATCPRPHVLWGHLPGHHVHPASSHLPLKCCNQANSAFPRWPPVPRNGCSDPCPQALSLEVPTSVQAMGFP